MKVLGVIPARGGSKGIRKKNIKLLNGKPLIYYTIVESLKSKLDRVIVSTESEEIASIALSYGIETIKRPNKLAEDESSALSVIKDALSKIDDTFDTVMLLQPTSPFRTKKHIDEALEIFEKDKDADSLVSVVKVPHRFHFSKQMRIDKNYLYGGESFIRRQDLNNEYYARNGAAIYISKIDILEKNILGKKIKPYFMNKIDSIDIDDLEDWFLVESIFYFKSHTKKL